MTRRRLAVVSSFFVQVMLMASMVQAGVQTQTDKTMPPTVSRAVGDGEIHAPRTPSDDLAIDDEVPLDDEARTGAATVDDVPDNSDGLSTDVDRWVLHDLFMTKGSAQSSRFDRAGDAPGLQSAQSAWSDRLELAQTEQLLRGEPSQHHSVDFARTHFDIPLANHPLVDLYIDYFTGRGRWFFEKWLARSGSMIPLMRPILARRGVPQDLVYLAMIESGFSPKAYSSAAAAGYWQFIPGTGRLFGLRSDLLIDERRDFLRSTEAAASYLSGLYKSLGDWHLAWASYNAGEGRIRRAMTKTRAKTFWELVAHKRVLAKETVHYVPKIIAAAIIAKDAERYGFVAPRMEPLQFDHVEVQGALDLSLLGRAIKVDTTTLKELNPALVYGVTPPDKRFTVRVPVGTAKQAQMAIARLPVAKRITAVTYRVQRGDTLIGIAKRTRSSVNTLAQFNRLGRRPIRPGQKLVIPGFRLADAPPATKIAKATNRRRASPQRTHRATWAKARPLNGSKPKTRHVVSHGDTLWSIARRYQVPMAAIRSHKRRAGDRLAVGDVLDIF